MNSKKKIFFVVVLISYKNKAFSGSMMKPFPPITDLLMIANITDIPEFPCLHLDLTKSLKNNGNSQTFVGNNDVSASSSCSSSYESDAEEKTEPIKVEKVKLRDKFTLEEDIKLKYLVSYFGVGNWKIIATAMETKNPRQCRERWRNYLSPNVKVNNWTTNEDFILVNKFAEIGPHWKTIAKFLRGRSPNSIRNRWKLLLKKSEKRENLKILEANFKV